MSSKVDFNLYLITDRHQTQGRGLSQVVEAALQGGVKAVQLREKDLTTRELYELAYEMRKLTNRYGARLLINDRVDIALAVDADGVHLGADSMPTYRVRKLLGENKLVGVSCHNQISAIIAQEKGADFLTFGPVYYTPSKAIYGAPVGLDPLEQAAESVQIPVFALGGVNGGNIQEVTARGASGIALISAIISADDPNGASRQLLALLPPVTQREEQA